MATVRVDHVLDQFIRRQILQRHEIEPQYTIIEAKQEATTTTPITAKFRVLKKQLLEQVGDKNLNCRQHYWLVTP